MNALVEQPNAGSWTQWLFEVYKFGIVIELTGLQILISIIGLIISLILYIGFAFRKREEKSRLETIKQIIEADLQRRIPQPQNVQQQPPSVQQQREEPTKQVQKASTEIKEEKRESEEIRENTNHVSDNEQCIDLTGDDEEQSTWDLQN